MRAILNRGALALYLTPFVVLLGLLTAAPPAFAQTPAATAVISFGPILTTLVLPTLQAVLLALASWAAAMIAARFHLTVSDAFKTALDNHIDAGIAYATTKFANAGVAGPAIAAEVVNYVTALAPTALQWLGVTPDSLAKMVTAKLPS